MIDVTPAHLRTQESILDLQQRDIAKAQAEEAISSIRANGFHAARVVEVDEYGSVRLDLFTGEDGAGQWFSVANRFIPRVGDGVLFGYADGSPVVIGPLSEGIGRFSLIPDEDVLGWPRSISGAMRYDPQDWAIYHEVPMIGGPRFIQWREDFALGNPAKSRFINGNIPGAAQGTFQYGTGVWATPTGVITTGPTVGRMHYLALRDPVTEASGFIQPWAVKEFFALAWIYPLSSADMAMGFSSRFDAFPSDADTSIHWLVTNFNNNTEIVTQPVVRVGGNYVHTGTQTILDNSLYLYRIQVVPGEDPIRDRKVVFTMYDTSWTELPFDASEEPFPWGIVDGFSPTYPYYGAVLAHEEWEVGDDGAGASPLNGGVIVRADENLVAMTEIYYLSGWAENLRSHIITPL